ncbi:S1 family peptidase [Microcoleus sp. B4-D4]|uniref:S1 family peptidase n=1 Tax=Microcoleus sp. B4-D4 TaxID=2818667 RepID=UPI002FD24355
MSNLLRMVAICAIAASLFPLRIAAQPVMANYGVAESQSANIERLARLMTVRILTPTASGSGAIVRRQGQVYTVLTSWHVVAFSQQHTIIAPDGQKYRLLGAPLQLGNADLAIVQFRSSIQYQVTRISTDLLTVGEPVFAAGFPMYRGGSSTTTFEQGILAFRFTQGVVSVLPPKSLAQGYRLGYTNDIAVGMSGGPIFNSQGLLIGINGRVKNRDPDFGVYAFEDGTEPSGRMLEQMVNSSWGIPISTYLRFISPYSSLFNYQANSQSAIKIASCQTKSACAD